jgi:hypothetical protein
MSFVLDAWAEDLSFVSSTATAALVFHSIGALMLTYGIY